MTIHTYIHTYNMISYSEVHKSVMILCKIGKIIIFSFYNKSIWTFYHAVSIHYVFVFHTLRHVLHSLHS